jgi:hypothetical protein
MRAHKCPVRSTSSRRLRPTKQRQKTRELHGAKNHVHRSAARIHEEQKLSRVKLALSAVKRHDVYHFEGCTRPRSAYPAARLAFNQGVPDNGPFRPTFPTRACGVERGDEVKSNTSDLGHSALSQPRTACSSDILPFQSRATAKTKYKRYPFPERKVNISKPAYINIFFSHVITYATSTD